MQNLKISLYNKLPELSFDLFSLVTILDFIFWTRDVEYKIMMEYFQNEIDHTEKSVFSDIFFIHSFVSDSRQVSRARPRQW